MRILVEILILLGIGQVLSLIGLAGTLIAFIAIGVRIELFGLTTGPGFTIKTKWFPIKFGIVPLGGFIKPDVDAFNRNPFAARVIVHLAGPLLIGFAAALALGFEDVGKHFVSGFRQYFEGAFSPSTRGRELIGKFFILLSTMPVTACGVLAIKLVAFQCLPIGDGACTKVLSEFVKRPDHTVPGIWTTLSVLITMPLMVAWFIALYHYFRYGP